MKGIILAGGSGSRLMPITAAVCKQLLPVYDKPMIYYPLSVLMLAGIRDILIISTEKDLHSFESIFGSGDNLGLNISYAAQSRPNGIAEAFLVAESYIGGAPCCLILGDNLFFGQAFTPILEKAKSRILTEGGATVFGYPVKDPDRFGVVEFDENEKVISIEEKPKIPKSSYAITGLYFYDDQVVDIAKSIKPSKRNELEITDVNQVYLNANRLSVEVFGRGFAWLDTGTYDSLIDASQFVQTIEKRQGYKIACIEEIALNQNWIDSEQLARSVDKFAHNSYREYLVKLLEK